MILVSFSSGEDALSNDLKIYHTFSSQGTETPLFRFFFDTRYTRGNVDGFYSKPQEHFPLMPRLLLQVKLSRMSHLRQFLWIGVGCVYECDQFSV